jgi:flagellar basal-body rod modification protein FlgD
MTVAAVNSSTAAASTAASSATSAAASAAKIGNQFLTLLVTQLQNQDPMNPMDNAQITTQLAQLSTVQGISDLNTNITSMVSQLQASQAVQGASLIGHSVLAQGATLALGSAGAAGGVDLTSAADQVSINIQDGNGKTVRTLNLGQEPAGLARFTWDGLDANGSAVAQGAYNFTVTATAAGNAVSNTAYSLGQVQSVSMASSGMNVEVSNLGSMSVGNIKQIF